MEFVSILDMEDVEVKDAPRDAFFEDLNIQQIIDEIGRMWGEDVIDYYRYFPNSKEAEDYRREITGDVTIPGVFACLEAGWRCMQECLKARESRAKARQLVQKQVWHIVEISLFTDAIETVYEGLKKEKPKSSGMGAFLEILEGYVNSPMFKEMKETSHNAKETLFNTRVTLTYENSRIVLAEGGYEETIPEDGVKPLKPIYEVLESLYPSNTARIQSPFLDNDSLAGMEQELAVIFIKKHPEVFENISKFFKKYEEYGGERIFRFFKEIPFYLSFVKFMNFYRENGAAFCTPTVDESRPVGAKGLYDLALFIANLKRGKAVISNDFAYNDSELFFVLTGPNQGGKTTFARSLGQLVFFTKMGLFVPAVQANLHYFSSIVTHFSVEESVETGRGKLMEELVRLKPMMDNGGENSFVIINELFTTAANYDAIIMGKKVLSHFIQKGCHGIYVTHLSELLDSEERAVGLCAQLDDNGIQTFKIEKRVMEYTNCAVNQVNKYGLTYEALKERLS